MTIIYQYMHRPNNTELGKGNTHETYLYIPTKVDLTDMFPPGEEVTVYDSGTRATYQLKSASHKEFRVNQLGEFYRNNEVKEGDEVWITKVVKGDHEFISIKVAKYNRVIIDVNNNGATIGDITRLSSYGTKTNGYSIQIQYHGKTSKMFISFASVRKKRADSPDTTDHYNITLDTHSLGKGSYMLDLDTKKLLDFQKCSYNVIYYDEEDIALNQEATKSLHFDSNSDFLQKIFFGAPGAGKSHIVNEITKGSQVIRTTFHPDCDYASFVGSYKPTKDTENDNLTYEFMPQAFTDAYVKAWRMRDKPIYLVIEEINRGNCAQIFGDLFQLLDRDNSGFYEFPVNADKDLQTYLEATLGSDHEGIKYGKLRLPPNLHILATMNTSDQSLFPMDSAFKRRWAWEYVPIDPENENSQFIITIDDKKYKWASFLKNVNNRIHELSDSEDKQMGNFFIKNNIDVEEFKSKVMFYLWSEVCKEYENSGSFFTYFDSESKKIEFTFNKLFPTNDDTNKILQGFMASLNVEEA